MEPFSFDSTTGQTLGAYDCSSHFQNLICLWVEDCDFPIIDESVLRRKNSNPAAVLLTPNEARAIGKKLLEFAEYADSVEPKGLENG